MRHTRLLFALALGAAACQTGPYNGTTTSGSVIGKTFLFQGYWNHPNTPISLQVMIDPTRDPALAASWVQFATASTDANPVTVNSTDPLYYWSVTAAPVPSAAFAARWPSGGLVRVRAFNVAGNRELTSFDDVTFPDCLTAQLAVNADWVTIGTKCAGLGGTALVSTVAPPSPAVGFLSRKGKITPAQTDAYYAAINAPTTLAAFRLLNGFPANEVSATYYNDGDLGLGREMHCTAPPSGGVACYVTNYSGTANVAKFGADPALVMLDAVGHKNSFATVAMTYDGAASTNPIKFMVYDAAGNLHNTAQLDSNPNDNQSIPNNCLSCHGINASYNPGTKVVSDAQFLPFDPFSYLFSTDPSYTYPAQANKFRQLNSLVLHTFPSPGIVEFITGMYAPSNIDDIHAVANPAYIPDAWKNADASQDGTAIYNGVIKVACRTCHLSAVPTPSLPDPTLDFNTPGDFATYMNLIRSDACGSHEMPHAERAMKKFWESGARAYLTAYFFPTSYPDPLQACK